MKYLFVLVWLFVFCIWLWFLEQVAWAPAPGPGFQPASLFLLSKPRGSYHVCPAVLSVPTSILLILAVCSKNRFVEAMTNAENKQSCVSLQECRNRPAIVGSVLTVLSLTKTVFIINSPPVFRDNALNQCFPNLSWRPPALHLLHVSLI